MDPNVVQGTGLLRVGSCGGRPRDTGPGASEAKAPLGPKTHTASDTKGCRKHLTKVRQDNTGQSHQTKTIQAGAGDYMLWLIAGNERLVC